MDFKTIIQDLLEAKSKMTLVTYILAESKQCI